MRHKQNPASGKHIRSQGSFYYNVKIISRRFFFTLRRDGRLPPAKNAERFSVIHRAQRGYNRGEGAR